MIREYSRKKDLPSPIAKQALFKSYIHAGEKYLRYGRRWAALRNFFQAWRQRPMSLVAWKKVGKGLVGQVPGRGEQGGPHGLMQVQTLRTRRALNLHPQRIRQAH